MKRITALVLVVIIMCVSSFAFATNQHLFTDKTVYIVEQPNGSFIVSDTNSRNSAISVQCISDGLFCDGYNYYLQVSEAQFLKAYPIEIDTTSNARIDASINGLSIDAQIVKELYELVQYSTDETIVIYYDTKNPNSRAIEYTPYITGYGGYEYRTGLLTANNLGTDFQRVATGAQFESFINNACEIFIGFVDGTTSLAISIVQALESLFPDSIPATSGNTLQFAGGWDKKTLYTYIKVNYYGNTEKMGVIDEAVKLKNYQFNVYNPNTSPANTQTPIRYNNNWEYSSTYNDYEDRQILCATHMHQPLVVDHGFQRFEISSENYTAYINP